MAAWYIRTRAEFLEVLAWTLACAQRRGAASSLWAHGSIASQLRAMQDWTKAGRTPTSSERARITIGLIAIREFDAEPCGEEARFIECLLQLAAYFEQWPDDPAVAPADLAPSPGLKLLAERRIGLIAPALHLAAGTATQAALQAALRSHAEHVRLPGLADELNPVALDPARVAAFVEGLARQPDGVLRRIEGRWLAIGVEGMHLAMSSPIPAEAIADGFELRVPDDAGGVVQASLQASLHLPHAQAVAARARAALAGFESAVATLEARDHAGADQTLAKWRRFAAACVWRSACRVLAQADSRFAGELALASDASARYCMPPWVGMPPR